MPGDQTHGRVHHNFGVRSPGVARESGVQNRDERCRTMKGRVGGELEEIVTKQSTNKTQSEPFEKSCSETAMPKSGKPKQLNQTEALVKPARPTN